MTSRIPAHLTLLLVSAILILLTPAFGQKKKKDAPPPAPQTEVRPSPKMGGTIRDILAGLQGQQTNLGILTKLTGDYVVFESEGDTLMYPLSTLQVVKFLKVDEGEARKIEIRFLSKD
jgi:hypothetical protein